MTTRDEEILVLELACLTEDRSPVEQRAMLAVAFRLDQDCGAFVSDNYRNGRTPLPPHLVDMVEGSYDPSDEKRLKWTKAFASAYERLVKKWKLHDLCGEPMGNHGPDDRCPAQRYRIWPTPEPTVPEVPDRQEELAL